MRHGLLAAAVLAAATAARATEPAALESPTAASEVLAEAAATAAPGAETEVFVTFDPRDLARAKGFPLSGPVINDARGAVFKVRPEALPQLSEFMHDNFHRCGGFFAYRTKALAQAASKPRAKALASAYTIDQSAAVTPLLPKVSESNLRSTISSLAAFNNRYYTAPTGVQAASWIQGRWQESASKIPGASVSAYAHDGWKQPSVVLTIPGSDLPDEIVVLGGHEDSINGWGNASARAPGADDNASGIAVLTETLRVLADSGWRPRRTVQFMAYAAEEVGLRGSQDIAEKYANDGKKVVAVIQYDMTNFKGSDEEIFLLNDYTDAGLNDFLSKLIDRYLGVKWSTTECGYGCSDHASWNKQGFPAAIAFESSFDGMNHNIHTDHDSLANSGGSAAHSVVFAKLAAAFAVETAKTARP